MKTKPKTNGKAKSATKSKAKSSVDWGAYDAVRGVRLGDDLFRRACLRARELGFRSFSAYVKAMVISDVNGFLGNVPRVEKGDR